MNNFTMLFLYPIIVVVAGLAIEYWIVQPLRDLKVEHKSTLANYLIRLFASSSDFSTNKVGVGIIEKIGSFLAMFPILLIKSLASLLIVFIAIPTFIILYYSEKFGGCKYTPTCKEYMVQALEKKGMINGYWLSIKRVARCNPFAVGGYDPLPHTSSSQMHEKQTKKTFAFTWKNIFNLFFVIFFVVTYILSINVFLELAFLNLDKEMSTLIDSPLDFVATIILAAFLWLIALLVFSIVSKQIRSSITSALLYICGVVILISWYYLR